MTPVLVDDYNNKGWELYNQENAMEQLNILIKQNVALLASSSMYHNI